MADYKLFNEIKSAILDLLSDLKDNVFVNSAEEQGEFTIVHFFFEKMPAQNVMYHCEEKLWPHRQAIAKREQSFFVNRCADLFEGLPSDRIQYYRNIIVEGKRFDDEDREVFWQHIEYILSILRKYILLKKRV